MPSDLEFALRMVLATVLSGIVGLERERGERAAGLRTHALVGLGSCLVMLVRLRLVRLAFHPRRT